MARSVCASGALTKRSPRFGAEPPGFAEGTFYMASWTSEIDWAFRETRTLLGEDFDAFAFVDVGCGKGKAVLRWLDRLQGKKLLQSVGQ